METSPLPNHEKVQVDYPTWVKMLFCIKHLMDVNPEYNKLLMDFYAKLWDIRNVDKDDKNHFKKLIDFQPEDNNREAYPIGLDEIAWELGLELPSWDEDKE